MNMVCTNCGKPIGNPHDWAYYDSYKFCVCVPVDSKEELIKGLAKLINKLIKDFDNEAHEYPCLLLSKYIIAYLASHGFVDSHGLDALIKQGEENITLVEKALHVKNIKELIEHSKKEERERIILKQANP